MKKATSQRRTKTTLIYVKPTWLPFFFDRELGMNSPRSLVIHVNYTFLSPLPNSNEEACSSLQEGAVGPQHNYSSFSFCQHSYYIWTSHDWVGRLFFKLILARSFNSPKHIIIFSVLRTHNLQGAHIQPLGYLWYFNVPFASRWGFETLTHTLTLFSNLVLGRFSPWLWRRAVWDKGHNTRRLVLKSFIGSKCKLTYSRYFVYLEYKKYSSSKSNQSCRQYPVDRLMITRNYIPCLGETHTKLYAMFKTETSLKSHTLFISISHYRPGHIREYLPGIQGVEYKEAEAL